MKHLKHLNKYFWKYRFRLLLGAIFIICSNFFNVLGPKIVGYAIDMVVDNLQSFALYKSTVFEQDFISNLIWALAALTGIFLGTAMLKGVFVFFNRQTIIVMSRLIEYDLRNEIYEKYQSLDTAFYKRNTTGDLMSRIAEDVGRVRAYLGPAIMYGINLTFLIIMVTTVMLSINVKLTMWVLAPFPILSVSIYFVNRLINKQSERIQSKLSDLTSIAQESFSGIRVIKAYLQEKVTYNFFEQESDNYKDESLRLVKIEALFFPLMVLLIGLSTIISIYVGGLEVINGRLTPGNIAEFVIYVNMMTWPVTAIGWVASIIQRAAASQKRINEFLEADPTVVNPTPKAALQMKGDIQFNQLSFVYPDTGIKALKDVNLHIPAGQRWAVVGKTGSGKTTLAELLLRMYDPTEGAILIDGQPLNQLNLDELRQQIGYVPQDVFLFSDTVQQNIAFGIDGAEFDVVQQAAKNAAIHKEIELFDKQYATVVGERGVTLSGGQKQRISIARALIKDPSILILDDCLSAVDADTEQQILNYFDNYLKDRTAIIITHRIFALLDFDQIIVLDDGKVAEQGTHQELLQLGGLYTDLYNRQQQEA